MNYQKIYNDIINRGKNRMLSEYKESHHIIPRCLGGTDDPSNLVYLTPEEHYTCHQLLVKIYPNDNSVLKAAMFMTANGMGRRSNKVYGWLKRRYSEYMSGPNNPSKVNGSWNKGISVKLRKSKITKRERENISTRMKQNNPCAGIKPWNHPRATDYTKSVWSKADSIYKIWLENNKPSYCKLHSLINGQMYNSKSIGPYMNMVKYFRQGWIPFNDTEWNVLSHKFVQAEYQ